MIETYEFDVELIVQTTTSMHGSSEVHTGYIYKRAQKSKSAGSKCKTKTFGVLCDPLFAKAWKICKSGLDGVLKHVAQQADEHIGSTEKRITRSASKKAVLKA
jgi:protein-arginine kinase activator protein McsA